MKHCKYCDRQWSDEVSVCPSCGGNEFEQICDNCGNAFEGMFCPKCGVRVGQEKKICPRCGKMYYSHACPDCGYVPSAQQSDYLHTPYMPPQPIQTVQKKKSRTWLWVLGWICMYPVPLTILMVRNKKMPRWARILIIALAWLVYLAIGLSESGT